MIWCKSIYILKNYSIHYILRTNRNNNKNIPSDKINVAKNILFFFLSWASTHNSLTFDLWFLYELKHKVHHFSEIFYVVFYFWFSLVSLLLKFTFFFTKKHGLFYFKEASTKNCEYVKKKKFFDENVFSDNVKWGTKKLRKMIYICWCKS